MIHEYDVVVLTSALAVDGLAPGDVGTVVHVYPRNEAYEVEFMTPAGKTVAVATVLPDQVRLANEVEIVHARTPAHS